VRFAITKARRTVAYAFCLAIALWATWAAIRWNWSPPLRVVRQGPQITIDTSTLGEYPTTVTRIRLLDLRRKVVVWELTAATPQPQILKFYLREGANPVQIEPSYGRYRPVWPADSQTFTLGDDAEYTIELWGGTSKFTRASAIFAFPHS
jgi:hypothetical protein